MPHTVKETARKRSAKAVKARLAELGYRVPLGHAYEVVAAVEGYRNWAVASSRTSSPTPLATAVAQTDAHDRTFWNCDFSNVHCEELTAALLNLIDPLGCDSDKWRSRGRVMLQGLCSALVWRRDALGALLDSEEIVSNLTFRRYFDLAHSNLHPYMPGHVRDKLEAHLTSLPAYDKGRGYRQGQAALDQHEFLTLMFTKAIETNRPWAGIW